MNRIILIIAFYLAPTMTLAEPPASDVQLLMAHCRSDHLSRDRARLRVAWALRCGHITANAAREMEFVNGDLRRQRTRIQYPTFTDYSNNFANTDNFFAFPVSLSSSCELPANYVFTHICAPRCFLASERVLFASGYKRLGDIDNEINQKIVILSEGAKARQPSYESLDAFLMQSEQEEAFKIVQFKTASGGMLSTTLDHPILTRDGTIADAITFRVGDHLVSANGTLDKIVEVQLKPYFGKVYSMQPNSTVFENNLYIAEGFLTGSWLTQSLRNFNQSQFEGESK